MWLNIESFLFDVVAMRHFYQHTALHIYVCPFRLAHERRYLGVKCLNRLNLLYAVANNSLVQSITAIVILSSVSCKASRLQNLLDTKRIH